MRLFSGGSGSTTSCRSLKTNSLVTKTNWRLTRSITSWGNRMRTIQLREHQTSSPMPLTTSELSQIAATKLVTVGVTSEPGIYVLQPSSIVGTVIFREFRLLIRPKVDLQNVFFLLGFRPDLITWSGESFPYLDEPDLINVMARLLDAAIERELPRGIARGYQSREESHTT